MYNVDLPFDAVNQVTGVSSNMKSEVKDNKMNFGTMTNYISKSSEVKSNKSSMEVMGNLPYMPDNPVMAMAYIPFQQGLQEYKVYDDETALDKGTLFPDLNKPWYGKKAFIE